MTTFPTEEAPAQRRRVSPPAWAAAVAVGLVVLGLLAYSIATGPSAPLQPGQAAPAFPLNDLEGQAHPSRRDEVALLIVLARPDELGAGDVYLGHLYTPFTLVCERIPDSRMQT